MMLRPFGKLSRTLVLLAALALLAAACGDDNAATTTQPAQTTAAATTTTAGATTTTAGATNRGNVDATLKVGYLLPSTGDLALLGPPMIKATELAVQDINAAGGAVGKEVALVGADDGTSPQVASQAADRLLTSEKVDAILGAAGTSVTLAVIDKITGAGVVQCSPSNTGSALTTYNDKGYYFRTAPPDNLQAIALAELVVADGHSAIGIIALNNEYGQGFAKSLDSEIRTAGGTVEVNVPYDPSGTDFDADVDKLLAASPDAVILIGYPDTGGKVLTSMIEKGAGPNSMPIYVTDGLQSGTLYTTVDANNPAVTQGIKGTAPAAAPEGGAPEFPGKFAAYAPGVDTIFSAHAYDCAIVIALAAEAAKSDDPTKFVKEMNNVTKGGEKCTSFQACKELLGQGTDIDYDGAAGPLDFADAGEPSAGSYDVYEFGADGKYTTLSQVQV